MSCVVWLWNNFWPLNHVIFFLCWSCAIFRLLSSWGHALSTAVCCVIIACLYLKVHHVKLRAWAVCKVIRRAPLGGMRAKGLITLETPLFHLIWNLKEIWNNVVSNLPLRDIPFCKDDWKVVAGCRNFPSWDFELWWANLGPVCVA